MAVSPFKTFSAGEVLTASDLNSSFSQVFNNGEDLGWPATKAKDLNGQELILDADADTSITADTDDQIDFKLGGTDLFKFLTVTSAVNGLTLTGAIATAGPTIAAIGSDTNIDLNLVSKGTGNVVIKAPSTGSVILSDKNDNEVLITADGTASAVNEVTVTNAATGNGPTISATGGDSNIDLNLAGKGSGVVKAGGNRVATVGANTFTGIQRWAKGADVASATALALGSDGNSFDVTGTTTIASINTVGIGTIAVLQFDGALTLTHHATDLVLPSEANITTAAGDIAVMYEYATGDWRCISYQKNSTPPTWPAGHINGLTISNAADADHDITFAAGKCIDSTDNEVLTLASALTKQIDSAWSVGDAAGGLFSGTVANSTTYHCFIIRKDSDGSIDAGFDTSNVAANIPAGYTAFRRVGSILTDSSSNILNAQYLEITGGGLRCIYDDGILDLDNTGNTSGALVTMSIPAGYKFKGLFNQRLVHSSANQSLVSDPDQTNNAIGNNNMHCSVGAGATEAINSVEINTDTSSQIRYRTTSASASSFRIATTGYIDARVG